VVGASGVLGGAIANELVRRGAAVIGSASSIESMQRIPDGVEGKIVANLLDAQSLETAVGQLLGGPTIDGLVLAAGRVGFGLATQTSAADAGSLMHINYSAQTWMASALLPKLAANGEFCIAAITGVIAEKPFPGMSAYSASKSALSSWLQVLRLEVRRQGGLVVEVRPGHTETGLATRALFGSAPVMPVGIGPDHVASKVVDAIEAGQPLLTAVDF